MFADVGFALSGLGYGLLLLLLFTVRKSGLAKYLLLLATAATGIWAVLHISALAGFQTLHNMLISDSVKQTMWMVFVLSCLRDDFHNLKQVIWRPVSLVMLSIPVLTLVAPYVVDVKDTWRFLGQTIIALQMLILLEVIYRQAGDSKWAFKPLVLYLGATNLFEFVTFANATMVGHVEPAYLSARGYIYACLLPLLVLAIRRIKHWGVDIFISREVVLHSSLLMVAGAYLFVMALVGYAVRYIGGEWGSTVQIVLFVLSLVLLMTLFMSNAFRVKIKIFITKHFFANQFDYRIEWIKLTEILRNQQASLPEVYHTALKGFSQAIGYPSAMLVKQNGPHLNVVASIEHEPLTDDERALLEKIHQWCGQKNWIVDIEELRTKPFAYEGFKVNHALLNDCRFKLVVPIYQGKNLWGSALLQTDEQVRRLNWELRDYLSAVTAQIASYVFHNEASQQVAENAQFAAFSRMSAFVLHDLKNVMAQIDLILCNAQQHKDNPEFIADTFETLEYTKARMDKMLKQLTEKHDSQDSSESLCQVSDLIEQVLALKCAALLPKPTLTVISEKPLVLDEEKFSNVIYHLVSNAQQATADDGKVTLTLELTVDERYLQVSIEDNGSGMSRQFIEHRLFKPFDTTKGNAGMGIGAYDAKNYMEKIGGRLDVESAEQQGTTFTLLIPIE
ncbi:PEP-CTERM system histidine kinase PrsK [Aestuariibacter halophilus]|uniref:histidine kinase n=1 Tax=Fluctibacter halophilus TaxID=226011 RepID=A0ABS8GBY5_9ALTE|nr:XrtA/PEP-CTERM system histidine kinase PrsK [Aestuariibacter halophilus]MCC2618080.1 PEP-CTERM system histidine kinase PrsK [Aestuariibacter halophilus]